MRPYFLVLILIISVPFHSYTQEKKASKSTSFYSIASAGYVFGESGVYPVAQLSSGIRMKDFKLGIGGGYDGYRFKSFPIFADIRMDFGKRKKFFGYVNGGYHFPEGEETFDIWSYPGTENWEGGLYADAGLGFRFKLGKKHNLLLSSSYNYKKVSHTKTYVYPCLVPPCPGDVYNYDYGLNYINTRLSWEINY